MRWSSALVILLPGVLSAYACDDAHQPNDPWILSPQPDVPSIGDRKYRDRDRFGASGGASSGGTPGSGVGGSDAEGGQHGEGGQGGASLGGQGGEASW